jgi:heme oxygenase (mycobilin-producing)
MTVARHYLMHAAEGHDATLETALRNLATAVRALPGSEGVELMRDLGNERRFVFIEKWESVEAHKAAGAQLPKEILVAMRDVLDGPPDGAYLDYLLTV